VQLQDAIATNAALTEFASECSNRSASGVGKMGGIEQVFLTYYAGLLYTTGFRVVARSGDPEEQAILDEIDTEPILSALRDARILYMASGYSNVIIAPLYRGSALPEEPTEQQISQYWARLKKAPVLERILGVEVAAITTNAEQITRKGYPLNRIASRANGIEQGKGILEEYAIEFAPMPILPGMDTLSFASPLESFSQVLTQYDNKQLPMIVELARAISLLLVKEPGLNEYAKENPEEYKSFIKEKMDSYIKMRANGVVFADSETDMNVISRDIAGLVDVAEVFRNRLSAESDGIPQDRLWNYSTSSAGMNTSDRNVEQERSRLRQLSPTWIKAITKWVEWSLWAVGQGELEAKVEAIGIENAAAAPAVAANA
jgi:hypothetical protein